MIETKTYNMESGRDARTTIISIPWWNFFFLALLLTGLGGCTMFRPTLHVAWVSAVPKPNGLVEKYPWGEARGLRLIARRGTGEYAETRPVELKACTDGRAISFLVRWNDEHESPIGRYWNWDDKRDTYQFQEFAIDQCALLFALDKHADLNPWSGRPETCDAWHWRAGWSDLSTYADDQRLIVRPRAWGTRPEQAAGRLYPLDPNRGMVELDWIDDAGTPGTAPMPKPVVFLKHRMAAMEMGEPQGSIADVQAQGVYTPKLRTSPNRKESWRYYSDGDDWFVEFYRLLVTPTKDAGDDYQFRGRGPHNMAVAIWDNDIGDNFYLTEPIRVQLDRQP